MLLPRSKRWQTTLDCKKMSLPDTLQVLLTELTPMTWSMTSESTVLGLTLPDCQCSCKQSKICELNYHYQKIWRTLTYDIQKHWIAISTLLDLISSVYHDLYHGRSNQQPQNAEPKLYDWATNSYRTQVTPN